VRKSASVEGRFYSRRPIFKNSNDFPSFARPGAGKRAIWTGLYHSLHARRGRPSAMRSRLTKRSFFCEHTAPVFSIKSMFPIFRPFCVILLALCLGFQAANAQKFSGIVAFGDSLSDLGNTYNYSSDFTSWLIGYDSYYYDQGRWSNGPLWVEDLDRLLGFPALQRNDGTNLYGTDFAWGGSTSADGYTSFTYYPDFYLPNLQTQIANYIKLLSTPHARMPSISQTLFTVWSGGNDVIYLVQKYSGVPRATPEGVRDHIATAITTLYNAGGRYFLVPNLPPLGDKPNYVTDPKWKMEADQFVDEYNPLLQSELAELSQKLSGITIIEFHVHALFLEVLKNYMHYGFTNVTQPAFYYSYGIGTVVSNPDQYLFWDVTHPTWIGHGILGQNAYDTLQAALQQNGGRP
jgi:phospholipase/lecithinase/hemolysin